MSYSSPSSSFRIRKSMGRGYSSRSSLVFASPSSSHLLPIASSSSSRWPVTATPTPPFPTSPAGTLLPPFPRSTFGRYIKTRLGYARHPRCRYSHFNTPSGDPSSESPLPTFRSCYRALVRPLASLRCAGSYSHFLAQADTRHLSDVNFICPWFIHSLCFSAFAVDVTKGSPLFPPCFFPFYLLQMYVYVHRIWLGHRRDVQLISYQRDLGVWMFPGVWRIRFLLAIALKLNAVFVPFFFFLNHMIIVYGYKILHAAYAMA